MSDSLLRMPRYSWAARREEAVAIARGTIDYERRVMPTPPSPSETLGLAKGAQPVVAKESPPPLVGDDSFRARYHTGDRAELLPRAKNLVVLALEDAMADKGRLTPLEEEMFHVALLAVRRAS